MSSLVSSFTMRRWDHTPFRSVSHAQRAPFTEHALHSQKMYGCTPVIIILDLPMLLVIDKRSAKLAYGSIIKAVV